MKSLLLFRLEKIIPKLRKIIFYEYELNLNYFFGWVALALFIGASIVSGLFAIGVQVLNYYLQK